MGSHLKGLILSHFRLANAFGEMAGMWWMLCPRMLWVSTSLRWCPSFLATGTCCRWAFCSAMRLALAAKAAGLGLLLLGLGAAGGFLSAAAADGAAWWWWCDALLLVSRGWSVPAAALAFDSLPRCAACAPRPSSSARSSATAVWRVESSTVHSEMCALTRWQSVALPRDSTVHASEMDAFGWPTREWHDLVTARASRRPTLNERSATASICFMLQRRVSFRSAL